MNKKEIKQAKINLFQLLNDTPTKKLNENDLDLLHLLHQDKTINKKYAKW